MGLIPLSCFFGNCWIRNEMSDGASDVVIRCAFHLGLVHLNELGSMLETKSRTLLDALGAIRSIPCTEAAENTILR